MDDRLPTQDEILSVLNEQVFETYNHILIEPSHYRLWILKNADKVIPNFREFSSKYQMALLEEYKKKFDKQREEDIKRMLEESKGEA